MTPARAGDPRVAAAADRMGRHVPELLVVAYVAVLLWAMSTFHGWEPLSFHLIYFGVAIVYGLRSWSVRHALLAIGAVAVATGAFTLHASGHGHEAWIELAEVPMMCLMFAAMVFHVERRRRAMDAARSLADERAEGLEVERRFFSRASHELRTPITIARGHLELLGRGADPTPEELAMSREVAIEELDRVDGMIDELLTVAKLASGAMERDEVEVAPLVRDVAARWLALPQRRWSLRIDATGTVEGSAAALGRALEGLIENAWKYTADGDAIAISTAPAGDGVALVVEDGGQGIPAGDIPRLFERFYRGAGKTSGSTSGSGLGLSIVQAVAQAHGGRVEVASELGGGTRFALVVPRSMHGRRAGAEAQAPAPAALPPTPVVV